MDCSFDAIPWKIKQNNESLLVRGNNCMGVVVTFGKSGKIKKFHWLVAGIDVGVYGCRIRWQHVGHARLLDAQFRSHKHEAGAVDGGPDLFLTWPVRVRLAHRQRIDCYRDDALFCREPIGWGE